MQLCRLRIARDDKSSEEEVRITACSVDSSHVSNVFPPHSPRERWDPGEELEWRDILFWQEDLSKQVEAVS